MYRQGGVLLSPVDEAPPGREAPQEEDGRLVLFTRDDKPVYTIVSGGATLILDEWREWSGVVPGPSGEASEYVAPLQSDLGRAWD